MAENETKQDGPATKMYKLLPGKTFDGIAPGGNRRTYEAGEEVPLTEGQYKAFKDRFTDDEDAYKAAVLEAEQANSIVIEGTDSKVDTSTGKATEAQEKQPGGEPAAEPAKTANPSSASPTKTQDTSSSGTSQSGSTGTSGQADAKK